jgi:hypothetical protein
MLLHTEAETEELTVLVAQHEPPPERMACARSLYLARTAACRFAEKFTIVAS